MSSFKLSILKRLERLQREFLWHGNNAKKKFHLVVWASICKSKKEGALGIRPLRQMYQALLGEWVWNWRELRRSMETNLSGEMRSL